jgi:RNA polymerase primary sigma factor
MPVTKRRPKATKNVTKATGSRKTARLSAGPPQKKGKKTSSRRGTKKKGKNRSPKRLLVVRPELFGNIPALTGNTKAKFPASEDTLEAYLAYFPSFDLLTQDEERYFSRLAHLGDELGRNRLVMHNIRLVASEALKYYNTRIPDNTQIVAVIQEGIFGLIRAVERFDPERLFRFSTYATHWIRRFIYRGSNSLRFIRLPHYIHGILARLPTISAELEREGGKAPTAAEIAARLKEREGAYHLAVQASHTTNIVKPAQTDEMSELGVSEDYLDSCNEDQKAVDPLDMLVDVEMGERLQAALDTLSVRDRKVVKMRYGIGYARTHTLAEIGTEVNLSRERIRQIENGSVEKLKDYFKEQEEDGQ